MAYTYGTVTNCKVKNGQTRKEYECRLGYQVNSQDIAKNTSNVTLQLQVRSIKSAYSTKGKGQTTTIDGTKVTDNKSFDMSNTNTWQTFGKRTITVKHSSNGTYSASKTGSFKSTAGSSDYSLRSGSASVKVKPKTIPRYATSNQSLKSKTSSSITMNWSSDSTVDYIWWSKDNGSSWTGVNVTDGTSGSYTISGLSANIAYNIKTRVRRKDSQLTTDSSVLSVTTHPKTIPSISLSSRTTNSITVSSSCNITTSSVQYRIKTSSGSYGAYQTSSTFSNLTPNTSYTVEVYMVGSVNGESGTATVNVTTYNYATLTAAPNVNIGSTHTITWDNPSGASISLALCKTDGTVVQDFGTVTGTSKAVTPTASSIYALTPNANTITLRYRLTTTQNSKTYTNTKDCVFTVTNSNPTFNNFDYNDTNTDLINRLTGNSKIIVNGYSNLQVNIPVANKAVGRNSATMKTYRLNVGNMDSVTANYSDTTQVNLPTINKVNSATMVVTATDSRNNSTQFTKTAEFKNYSKPVIKSLSVEREEGGVGEAVDLSFNGSWWNNNFGKTANTIKIIEYYYKETSKSEYTQGTTVITATTSGNDFSGVVTNLFGPTIDKGFDVEKSYNIKLIVKDELDSSTEFVVTLGSGTPAIAIYKSSVAIGKKYDEELGGTLQVDGYDVSNKFKQYLPLIGGSLKGDINFEHNLGVSWKEEGYEDKFKIVSTFSGADDDNKLKIMGAVGEEVPDPELYDLVTISGKSGNLWIKGDVISSEGILQAKPVSLYDNSSGTTGTVTLSKSAANFTILEIFFTDNNYNTYSSIRVYSPNSKNVGLYMSGSWVDTSTGKIYTEMRTRKININGTTITNVTISNKVSAGYITFNPTAINQHVNNNYINIVKIYGYR